jgi:hypothetical protein
MSDVQCRVVDERGVGSELLDLLCTIQSCLSLCLSVSVVHREKDASPPPPGHVGRVASRTTSPLHSPVFALPSTAHSTRGLCEQSRGANKRWQACWKGRCGRGECRDGSATLLLQHSRGGVHALLVPPAGAASRFMCIFFHLPLLLLYSVLSSTRSAQQHRLRSCSFLLSSDHRTHHPHARRSASTYSVCRRNRSPSLSLLLCSPGQRCPSHLTSLPVDLVARVLLNPFSAFAMSHTPALSVFLPRLSLSSRYASFDETVIGTPNRVATALTSPSYADFTTSRSADVELNVPDWLTFQTASLSNPLTPISTSLAVVFSSTSTTGTNGGPEKRSRPTCSIAARENENRARARTKNPFRVQGS